MLYDIRVQNPNSKQQIKRQRNDKRAKYLAVSNARVPTAPQER